jgi:bis(5'-nucleosyl)-tetraphosphatase (symmetrical)
MATYAIGDIQGCYDELRRLLDRLEFNPAEDRIWFVGDLVNRGPLSLQVLRFVRNLKDRAVTVLGNHDLHLLALAAGNEKHSGKSNLQDVLEAPDRDELVHWLRHQPVMHYDPGKGFAMIHAGLPPQWTLHQALSCARELEQVLRGPDYGAFIRRIYGNEPSLWSDSLEGMDRLRFVVNCLTRLRYCDAEGKLALKEKRVPGAHPPHLIPWFAVPGRETRGDRILFGHWSTLGYIAAHNVWSLDSGCVWGGSLTAIRLRKRKPMSPVSVECLGT